MPTVQQAAAAIEASRAGAHSAADDEDRVTPLELFFDLVCLAGVGRLRVLTNTLDTDRGVRIVMFAAMIAMFVVSLAIPGAFGEQGVSKWASVT